MAVPFSRTLRAIRTDRHLWGFGGLTLLLLALAALVWTLAADVTVYEVSSSARLEVLAAPQSVVAEVEGRVVSSKLRVGLEILAGDILVTLDGESVRRSIDELRQQISSTRSRIEAIRAEIDARQRSLEAQSRARELAVQESQAQLAAAESRTRFAHQSLQRAEALAAQNAFATGELERIGAEAETAQALVEAARLTVARGEQDRFAEERSQEAELASVRHEAVRLAGELAVQEATQKRLEHELELRSIRGHIAGRIEEVTPFRLGTVVRPSEKLATVVPPGEPRVVAQLPVIAVGRVRPGQQARLRLDGFPWTQYGTLNARVTGVGNEASEGLIRVELAVFPDPTSRIPLQHGQTGSVEIVVERATPAVLMLRAAGEYLMKHRPATGA